MCRCASPSRRLVNVIRLSQQIVYSLKSYFFCRPSRLLVAYYNIINIVADELYEISSFERYRKQCWDFIDIYRLATDST